MARSRVAPHDDRLAPHFVCALQHIVFASAQLAAASAALDAAPAAPKPPPHTTLVGGVLSGVLVAALSFLVVADAAGAAANLLSLRWLLICSVAAFAAFLAYWSGVPIAVAVGAVVGYLCAAARTAEAAKPPAQRSEANVHYFGAVAMCSYCLTLAVAFQHYWAAASARALTQSA